MLLKKFFRFDMFITRKFLPVIYILGAAGITLVSVLSLLNGIPDSFSTKAASSQTDSSSIVFWIVVLLVGNIVWRFVCEASVAVFRIYDSLFSGNDIANEPGGESYEYPEREQPGPEPDAADLIGCPHCSATVRKDQLRECEHCGVTGCERCIRMTGLVRKTMTCRDCFERR